ncbi:ComF family protein [Gimesia fumaroli]|uniref:DNA utilization protein GntX n=1 Tax=Gimesia fumaroli TaxID=2527976 RepID=A0A518IJZ3_9PLAN|nr:ComF family protein [Gimesia fumaroli]QDV53421.1 DNA utilization protein GntX [Gimesia fumaroli]
MKYLGIQPIQRLSTRWLKTGRGFVYPPRCSLCGLTRICSGTNCGVQIEQIAPVVEQACERCGVPVGPHLDTSLGCAYCKTERFLFHRAVALGKYQGPLREIILNLKQNHGAHLGGDLGSLLFHRNQETFEKLACSLVIPVPLHWTSRLHRTHNPASIIAEALSGRLQAKYSGNILAKRKRTPAQTSLTPSNRRKNLRDAFVIRRRKRLAGQTVLLVDDVMTTGSTANAATRVLLEAGASEINVAVIARAPGL